MLTFNYKSKFKTYIFLLLTLLCAGTGIYGQSSITINPNGGKGLTDGLKIVINPNASLEVYRNNQPQTSEALLSFRFDNGTTYNATPVSFTPLAITAIDSALVNDNTGTPKKEWRTSISGCVTSTITQKKFHLTIGLTYMEGNSYFTTDYIVRSPQDLTTPETMHIYMSHKPTILGSSRLRALTDNQTLVNVYGLYLFRSENDPGRCGTPSNELYPAAHAFVASKARPFRSVFASTASNRATISSDLKLGNVVGANCDEKGVAVEIITKPLSRGQMDAPRVLQCYMYKEDAYSEEAIETTVPTAQSSAVTVNFTNSAFDELEGSASHNPQNIKIRVSGGVLASDEVCEFSIATGGTNGNATENKDFQYVKGFTIPAGNYNTNPREFVLNNIRILGNTKACEPDRTFTINVVPNNDCNDLINAGAISSAKITIKDDETPLAAGSISTQTTSACLGTQITINSATAGTGTGTIYYKWQSSSDGSSWSYISGATSASYTGTLNVTHYRRETSHSSGECSPVYSNVIQITIGSSVVPGTISAATTETCSSSKVQLTGEVSTNGSNLTYQWQSKPAASSSWADIASATSKDYEATVTAATSYRRATKGGCTDVYSNEVTITIGAPDPGVIIILKNSDCIGELVAIVGPSILSQYQYQWQRSFNGSTWTNATSNSQSCTDQLEATTYYRRKMTIPSGSCAGDYYSNVVVIEAIGGGTISVPTTTVCSGTEVNFTGSAVTGGKTIAYQWESSSNGVNWSTISQATEQNYKTSVTTTTYYRRKGTSDCNSPAYSNTILITALPSVTAGTITASATTICDGSPAILTGEASTGGSNLSYQWQSSPDGQTWSDIAQIISQDYTAALTTTTYFRRITKGGCSDVYSNEIKITVGAPINPGGIPNPLDAKPCASSQFTVITLGVATGGSGNINFEYEWQISPDSISWTPASLDPTSCIIAPGITESTYFRRKTTDKVTGCFAYSGVLLVEIVGAGMIHASATSVCRGERVEFTGNDVRTGTEAVSYLWESSSDGVAWNSIGATGVQYATNVTATTYFRRKGSSNTCGDAYSNEIKITIIPEEAYWSATPANGDWNDASNWVTSAGAALNAIPGECTVVYIPGNATNYPSLNATTHAKCKEIHFHFGAELAKPHLLEYEKAYIQYNFGYYDAAYNYKTDGDPRSSMPLKRGQWNALAAPLKKIVNSDFSLGGYPNTWQQSFKRVSTTGGDFVGQWGVYGAGNAMELGSSQAYSISLWMGEYIEDLAGEGTGYHKNLNDLNGVIEIPYFENKTVSDLHRIHKYENGVSTFRFYYSDVEDCPLVDTLSGGTIARGQEAYRFVFDNNLQNITLNDGGQGKSLPLNVTGSQEIMIGNPFMSNLDFRAFYERNKDRIYPYFRLYDGTQFVVYDYTSGAHQIEAFIPPLQAFFVQTKGSGAITLDFVPDEISVVRPSNKFKLTSSAGVEDVLYISAENGDGVSYVTLNFDPYVAKNNVYNLFTNDYPGVPQFYALDEHNAKNAVLYAGGYETIIPLGIRCEKNTSVTLQFHNLERVHASSLTLIDKKLGKSVDLSRYASYRFDNDAQTEAQDRFELRAGVKAPTAVDNLNEAEAAVSIYAVGKELHVRSSETISQIRVTSMQGTTVALISDCNSTEYTKQLTVAPGVYHVSVVTDGGKIEHNKVIIR